jgi:hypothetical protein
MTSTERSRRSRAGKATKHATKQAKPATKPRDSDNDQEIDEGRVRELEKMLRQDTSPVSPENHWNLFLKAVAPMLRELKQEGKASAARASPANVAIQTEMITRLIEHWPALPFGAKQQLAAAKTTRQLNSSLRTLKLGRWSEDEG